MIAHYTGPEVMSMRDRSLNYLIAAAIAILLTGAAVLSVVASTCEELEKEIAGCAAIDGDLERLECYDRLAQSLGLDRAQPVPTAVEGNGKWQVSVKTNPLDDTTTVVLGLYAGSGTSARGGRVLLILRCKSNKTEAYISWDDYLGSEARATWRIGAEDARTSKWGLSTDKEATFYPYDAIAFIRQLLNADRLVAQVTPYSEDPVTAVFDLTGLTNAIRPLQNACGWQ
jgi:type VI secretion system protein VasI